MLKKILYFATSIALLIFVIPPSHTLAAKIRVKKPSLPTAPRAAGLSYSSVKLSRPTNSVVLTMKNLQGVTRVDYILNYIGSGVSQGVGGSFSPSGQASESRDLYFGTCSHGVCTAHRNIKNASLVVTTKLQSGGQNVKRYRINF